MHTQRMGASWKHLSVDENSASRSGVDEPVSASDSVTMDAQYITVHEVVGAGFWNSIKEPNRVHGFLFVAYACTAHSGLR